MKKLKGIIIGILLFGGVVGGIIFWQANKKVEDPSNIEIVSSYRVDQLMQMDESSLNSLKDKMIAVSGIVLSNQGDDIERTVTLGANELESVVCQIDNRHLAKFSKLVKGHFVSIKGIFSGHDFDDMLGKTVQMKNCAANDIR